ncbi:uncharacterized protein LOC119661639 isoform X2 [Hermetia illucens]|uniref:uncharacterized protein LOC119661639 isoform X2 n=1 Tax=Hermetia illucens TaxID=343691 RepID=UPI0018CC1AFA|nr:uncharacterized protein LOC119661639 isoform X2 [Hermetia illucens]
MDTFGTNAKFEAPAFSKSKAVYSSELAIPIETQTDHNTIKQVFITKLIFLLPTIIQAIPLMLVEDSRMYLKDNSSMVYFALVLYASATLIFTFLPNMQNRNPYTIVSAFVMIESLTAIIAFISSYYQGIVVLTSFGAAVIACVSLAALGIYCTLNLDKINVAVFGIGVLIFIVGIIIYAVELFVTCYTVNAIYSILALLVMYIYFFHAVQGLNDKTKPLEECDKFIVAMSLYTNFITIFLLCENLFTAIKI